jgi:hypothetical protein
MTGAGVDLGSLLNLGAVGLILAWFLLKSEPRMLGMEEAIDRNTRGVMLSLLAQEEVSAGIKRQAQAVLEEVAEAEKRRRRAHP